MSCGGGSFGYGGCGGSSSIRIPMSQGCGGSEVLHISRGACGDDKFFVESGSGCGGSTREASYEDVARAFSNIRRNR